MDYKQSVDVAGQQLRTINRIRAIERQMGLDAFQRGQLAGAQQALAWLVDGCMAPIEALLTGEQRAEVQLLLNETPKSPGHFEYAGKLGPWARRSGQGRRFLDVGFQGHPSMREISSVEKEGETWRYILVYLVGSDEPRSCGCNLNTYVGR